MTDPRDDDNEVMLQEPRAESAFRGMALQDVIPPNMQLAQRNVSDMFGAVSVAQLVPVPRNIEHVMKKMTVLATQFGDKYVYSWDVKKKGGGVDTIEGGTVDLAYDLAREYGNNCVDVRQTETQTHLVFYARFTDLETGYTTTRAFQQRKSQTAGGRMDADRQLDITYQIGQSKAVRNVVLKALNTYAEYCIEEAKRGMFDKIKSNPDKYRTAIDRGLEKFQIELKDAERQVGRTKANWTIRDIASIFAKLKSVDEGMAAPQEAFPKDGPQIEPAGAETKKQEAKKQDPQQNVEDEADKKDDAAGSNQSSTVGRSGEESSKSPTPDQTQGTKAKPATTKKAAAKPKALFPDGE